MIPATESAGTSGEIPFGPENLQLLEALRASQLIIREHDYSPYVTCEIQPPGIYAKTTQLINAFEEPLRAAFQSYQAPDEAETSTIISRLSNGKFAFAGIGSDKQSSTLAQARGLFVADQAGIALRVSAMNRVPLHSTVGVTIIDGFSALQRQGTTYRLLGQAGTENAEALTRAVGQLAPPGSEVGTTRGKTLAIIPIVEDARRPTAITQDALDDWISRVQDSQVKLNIDVGEGDQVLDNFLEIDGRLYWCDGDIMGAKPATPEELQSDLAEWQATLGEFVAQERPQANSGS